MMSIEESDRVDELRDELCQQDLRILRLKNRIDPLEYYVNGRKLEENIEKEEKKKQAFIQQGRADGIWAGLWIGLVIGLVISGWVGLFLWKIVLG